jgi:hypothetical protein
MSNLQEIEVWLGKKEETFLILNKRDLNCPLGVRFFSSPKTSGLLFFQ